ncbi:DUF222 domain-containing protein [Tsukamurella sp. NPDC003166]|uniref:HNH endonuclease signature motif containing protein n=1 Tax=Tsukamurella sp. NPDC003166 TaxID=3154444 RepID=UPI0033A7C1DE
MTTLTSTAVDYHAALEAFESAAEMLAGADPVMLSSQQTLDALLRLETAARKVPYAQNRIAQASVEHRVPDELGYTGLKELLQQQLHLGGGEARDRIHGARSRVPRRERGFSPEPSYPLLAQAQRDGLVSERHAAVIDRILHEAGKRTLDPGIEVLEDILVTAATTMTPESLAKAGKHALDLIDPDGAEPDHDAIARKRELHLGKQGDDLMSGLSGAVDPTCRALLETIMEKFARPGVLNPDDHDAPIDPDDADAVREAAKHDQRTTAQRCHDALQHALGIALGSGALGSHRGVPCQPIITLRLDQLESETGIATTATGGRMPVPDAINLMGINPRYVLLLDLQNRPLFLGRTKRLASADQRIALYGSERGCSAPGCDAPATRCQVHHVTDWAEGGKTDITTLTLVCDAHHGKVVPPAERDHRPGWETITLRDGLGSDGDYAGRTGWRRTRDPNRAYRVNHTHHADELHRAAVERWKQRRAQFIDHWRREDLRQQYYDAVGTTYEDIAAILDGPHGPPILEALLAEHDAETAWQTSCPDAHAA